SAWCFSGRRRCAGHLRPLDWAGQARRMDPMPALPRAMSFAALALLALPAAADGDLRTPPAPHCLDARQVGEVFQSGPRTLAVVQADGQRFRVDLGADCPGATAGNGTRMLAAAGW